MLVKSVNKIFCKCIAIASISYCLSIHLFLSSSLYLSPSVTELLFEMSTLSSSQISSWVKSHFQTAKATDVKPKVVDPILKEKLSIPLSSTEQETELVKIIETHKAHIELTSRGRVKVTLTNHELLPNYADVVLYFGGKKFRDAYKKANKKKAPAYVLLFDNALPKKLISASDSES